MLAQDCRDVIVETITKTGGHLASNLGVVELTLALHRAFDSPKDRLVWDTSNQCYTHKLVTGRRDQFPTIRTPGGLSGFAEPTESAARHAGGRARRNRPLLRARDVDRAAGRPRRPVRRRHRRRRRADLGPELRGAEQHRPRQAQAPDRRSSTTTAGPSPRTSAGSRTGATASSSTRSTGSSSEAGHKLLQAPAARRQGLGAGAQAQELGRRPLLPEPDLGRARASTTSGPSTATTSRSSRRR